MHRTEYNTQCTIQAPNPNPHSGHQLIKPAITVLHSWKHVGQNAEDKHAKYYCFTWQTFNSVFFFLSFFFFNLSSADTPSKFTKMIPNGYLIFEDESFLDSTVAKMNALRKSGQFCDVRLQVWLMETFTVTLSQRSYTVTLWNIRGYGAP